MEDNQVKLLVWRDLKHRSEGYDDNSDRAWKSHNARKDAVLRILSDPAYRYEETEDEVKIEKSRLNDTERTHEVVEYLLWFFGLPVVKAVAIFIGGKIVENMIDRTIDATQALLTELWNAWKNKEIGGAEIHLPNGQFVRLNNDGTFTPGAPDVELRAK